MSSLMLTPLLAFLGVFGYALYTADPQAISIGPISSSGWIAYNGYDSKTLSVMLQTQLMAVEQVVKATRGMKYTSEDKVRDKAVEVMTDSLQIGKPIKAIQTTLGLIPLQVGGAIVENGKDVYLLMTAYSSDGRIFKVKKSIPDTESIDSLLREGVLALLEQADHFVVADYWFRTEKKDNNFVNTTRLIRDGLLKGNKADIPWYYSLMGQVSYAQGRYEEAIGRYQQALAADPKIHRPHLHWARALIKLNRFQEAETQLALAEALSPTDSDTYEVRGTLYQAEGEPIKAMQAYAQALKVNPYDAEVYLDWGLLLRNRGRTADAVEALRRAAYIAPKNKDVQTALKETLAADDSLFKETGKTAAAPGK